MSVISHITLGSNDTERSGRFYDEVLGVLGFERLPKPPGKPPAYEKNGMPTIYVYTPEDGWPATWGNGTHVAFVADTKEDVRAFHDTALRLGGSSEG
ncbi:MAG: VOC family protein, partial [Pseudomonadota bacterium]